MNLVGQPVVIHEKPGITFNRSIHDGIPVNDEKIVFIQNAVPACIAVCNVKIFDAVSAN